MKNVSMQTGRFTTMLAAVAWGAGVANAQQGGNSLPLIPPEFDAPLVFDVSVGNPYGLASADFLDADGNPGQDGYPEIAVAGAGLDLFLPQLDCADGAAGHDIKIYHNKGASVNWDGTDGPDPDDDPDNPYDALVVKQTISIDAVAPGMWAMELAFADVTGQHGPDLILVGMDPDSSISAYGRLLVFENLGNGLFDTTPTVNTAVAVPLRGLVTADFDLDGDIDIVAAAAHVEEEWYCTIGEQDVVVAFRNDTSDPNNLILTKLPLIQLGTANDTAPGDLALGDFFVDGPGVPLLDLATPNLSADSVTSIENLDEMAFLPLTINPPGECSAGWPYATATGDQFGADAHWDFAAVDANDLLLDVFSGDSTGTFVSTCDDPYPLFPTGDLGYEFLFAHGIASGKIDNGPNPDLVVALGNPNYLGLPSSSLMRGGVAVLLGKGDGTFQIDDSTGYAYFFRVDEDDENKPCEKRAEGSANVLVVDLDADGFDDIVVVNHFVLSCDNNPNDTITVLINTLEVTGVGGP